MGLSFSCPFTAYTDLEKVSRSIAIGLEDDEVKSLMQSNSFRNQDSETTVIQSMGTENLRIERSVIFEVPLAEETGIDYAKMKEMCTGFPGFDNVMDEFTKTSIFDPGSPEHEAAIKLQKVYKSFRTRRKLADCAVQIEQSLWKLLDFAELKRSSISFFNLDKQETAFSRWSRARTRAAKVGKGLSKNSKAQKLALQHWLEAIDPRHRYGHNLHFYYGKWLLSQSKEPFFYWLDIGEGKEINLVEKCPRSKLQQQCIKYLGPIERKAYEVVMEDGKLLFKQTGEFLDTTGEPKGAKWIFVLSTSKILYVGVKKKGSFQHSSFLAGGATLAAGRIVAEKGTIKAIWPHSGHYRPTQENFQDFISFLQENNVDTTYVKMDSDDDKELFGSHIRTHSSEEDMSEKERPQNINDPSSDNTNVIKQHAGFPSESPMNPKLFHKNLSTLEIPNSSDDTLSSSCSKDFGLETILDGYEAAEDAFDTHKANYVPSAHELSDDEDEPCVLERIKSHKEPNSCFQLGRQLSCKWSTGAGPRIGCLRDYPTELQSQALEEANLSPRSAPSCSLRYTNTVLCTSPLSFENRSLLRRNNRPYRTQSTPLNMGWMNEKQSRNTRLFD
ncbi:IQ domain-containing protein IQM2-like [Cynara cardunculus var. scolymus]|uniref:IQ domain-containing protein IQM2-like n=1 Tax=Cynara cardunculus var. scolymus TaxID=59895 RepID=UPI000D623D85|nr:IQ domain-containing protein IQM2-like [Cynara cardunculus var. scolymus]